MSDESCLPPGCACQICREFQTFLDQTGVMASPIEVEEIFATFDSNHDGSISLDEFESLVATLVDKTKRG